MDPIPRLEAEPALSRLLELLQALPRFDPSKRPADLQGDLRAVQEAEEVYHSFNRRYQQSSGGRTAYSPLLLELFKLSDWQNFQRLLSHSTVGRERKAKRNARHRTKQKQESPEAWLDGCRAKRLARYQIWEQENHPRLLAMMAEAEQQQGVVQRRLRCLVLNELEAKCFDQGRAEHEYHLLQWRVLLGLLTQTQDAAIHRRLERLAQHLWENPEATLKQDLAKRLPPITTDWGRLEEALEASLTSGGENH